MQKFSVVIQAGGQSRRMGADKGLLPFGHGTLVEYILAQVTGLGDEQIIISNQPEDYARFGLPVFTDVFPGKGALGGIYSAIFHAKYDHVLLLACDMPFVNLELIDYLLSLSGDHDVVVPVAEEDEYVRPFRAVYAKTCLPAIEAALERGERKVISFFGQVDVHYVSPEQVHRFDPQERTFININTPQDLENALNLTKN
jgi:molybdopterin-guanine dinucleotide biosynthesis protein A